MADQCHIVVISVFIASRFLDSVPLAAIGYFRESAEKLIEEKGAVEALAAALAHISGATRLEQRSLLNSDAVSLSETELEHTNMYKQEGWEPGKFKLPWMTNTSTL